MAIRIRTPKNAWSIQEVTIDDNVLNIELKYLTRPQEWIMNIYDSNNNIILAGLALRETQSLTKTYLRDPFNNGNLWVLRVSSEGETIDRSNLGSQFQLFYLTEEEASDAGLQ